MMKVIGLASGKNIVAAIQIISGLLFLLFMHDLILYGWKNSLVSTITLSFGLFSIISGLLLVKKENVGYVFSAINLIVHCISFNQTYGAFYINSFLSLLIYIKSDLHIVMQLSFDPSWYINYLGQRDGPIYYGVNVIPLLLLLLLIKTRTN